MFFSQEFARRQFVYIKRNGALLDVGCFFLLNFSTRNECCLQSMVELRFGETAAGHCKISKFQVERLTT